MRIPSLPLRSLSEKSILKDAIKTTDTKYTTQLYLNDAELYQQNNELQKRDALNYLKEYEKKFRWQTKERVLDIGCGDGGVTTTILQRFIPSDFATLTGCDISEQMVRHASDRHGGDRVRFQLLDIAGTLPPSFRGDFQHAFSFYALHWVRDQERAFSNIFKLLSPGGECLLVFLGYMPVYEVFRGLARQPKWSRLLADVERFVSPHHDSQNPEETILRIMQKTEFKNIEVQTKERTIVYRTLHDYNYAMSAVNPFTIPLALEEEFQNDHIQQVKDMRFVDQANNSVKMNYKLIVAYGKKEENPHEEGVSDQTSSSI